MLGVLVFGSIIGASLPTTQPIVAGYIWNGSAWTKLTQALGTALPHTPPQVDIAAWNGTNWVPWTGGGGSSGSSANYLTTAWTGSGSAVQSIGLAFPAVSPNTQVRGICHMYLSDTFSRNITFLIGADHAPNAMYASYFLPSAPPGDDSGLITTTTVTPIDQAGNIAEGPGSPSDVTIAVSLDTTNASANTNVSLYVQQGTGTPPAVMTVAALSNCGWN